MTGKPYVQSTINLPAKQHEAVSQLAEANERSFAAEIRVAVARHLDTNALADDLVREQYGKVRR